jgi:hypothetical protein
VKSSQEAGLWTHIPGAVAFHTPNDVHALDATSSKCKGRESAKEGKRVRKRERKIRRKRGERTDKIRSRERKIFRNA